MKSRFLSLISFLLLLALIFTGCSPKLPDTIPIESQNSNGTTQPNITLMNGFVAEHGGFIYFSTMFDPVLYEYDPVSGSTVQLPLAGTEDIKHGGFHALSVYQDRLYMTDGGTIYSVKFDGKDLKKVCDITGNGIDSCLYIEYPFAYYTNAIEASFFRVNLEDGTSVKLIESGYRHYCATDDDLYVITRALDKPAGQGDMQLYRADKETFTFQHIPLPFQPIEVIPHGDDLYIVQSGVKFKLHKCTPQADGTFATEIVDDDIDTMYYQFCGEKLLYLDESTFSSDTSSFSLCSYDPVTGKKQVVAQLVSFFYVINDTTVCYCTSSFNYFLTDLTTGKTVSIPYPGE